MTRLGAMEENEPQLVQHCYLMLEIDGSLLFRKDGRSDYGLVQDSCPQAQWEHFPSLLLVYRYPTLAIGGGGHPRSSALQGCIPGH